MNPELTPPPPPKENPSNPVAPDPVTTTRQEPVVPISTPTEPELTEDVVTPVSPIDKPAEDTAIPVSAPASVIPAAQPIVMAAQPPRPVMNDIAPAKPLATVVVSPDHQSSTNPPPIKSASFKALRLILVLLLIILITGASLGIGIALINKQQKPFEATTNTTTTSSTPTNWVAFANTTGNFSALFPTTPTQVPETTQTTSGVSYTFNGFQSGNSDTAYLVSYVTYSSNVDLSTNASGALTSAVQGEANELQNGKLVSANPTSLSGLPAETYELTGSKDGTSFSLTGEVILKGNVLYDIIATHAGGDAPNAHYFIDNFKLGQ